MGLKEYREAHKFDAQFNGIAIRKDQLRQGFKSWPIAECEAMVDQGANVAARVTATRVALGTVILPGIGTIVGALAQKNRSKIYLAITIPDDDVLLIELKSTKEGEARKFANAVNRAARHYATHRDDKSVHVTATISGVEFTPAIAPTTPAGWYPVEGIQRYWDGQQWTEHVAPLTDPASP